MGRQVKGQKEKGKEKGKGKRKRKGKGMKEMKGRCMLSGWVKGIIKGGHNGKGDLKEGRGTGVSLQ